MTVSLYRGYCIVVSPLAVRPKDPFLKRLGQDIKTATLLGESIERDDQVKP
jgi:hypothetical protein